MVEPLQLAELIKFGRFQKDGDMFPGMRGYKARMGGRTRAGNGGEEVSVKRREDQE